jgi:uncharacterized ferritin-like protein (DUF455 family)
VTRTCDPLRSLAGLLSFERALLVATADRIARAPSLPAKMFLCRAVWRGACRIRALRRALPRDLAITASNSPTDPHTQRLIEALTALTSEAAFLTALCRIVAPFAVEAYRAVCVTMDAVTVRGIRSATAQHRRLAAGRYRWIDRRGRSCDLRRELGQLGALATHHEVGLVERTPRTDLARTSTPLREPERECAIRALREGEAREDVWFVSCPAEYRQYLHQLIAFEINTFEAVSRHVAEFAWMPWEFHWDMVCQIRDELQHLEMWLERLPRAGGRLGQFALSTHEFAVCTGHELPARIALLERLVESSALDSLDLNRCLWESRGDTVMVAYLNRVQIDEIGHVRQGNKWLRRLYADDGEIVALVDRAERVSRERMLAAARALERAGVVPSGNVELVRRKFDDPLILEVDRAAREQAGFSNAEIEYEIERRRRSLTVGTVREGEPQ